MVGASGQSAALASLMESKVTECTTLSQQVAAKEAIVTELTQSRDALADDVRTKYSQLAEMKATLEKEPHRAVALRDECAKLTKDVEDAYAALDVLQAAKATSVATVEQQTSQISALKDALDSSSAKASDGQEAQANVSQLVDDNAALKVRIGQAETELASERSQLKANQASTADAAAAAATQDANLQAKVSDLETKAREDA
jgi:chromosome segregation ATPase